MGMKYKQQLCKYFLHYIVRIIPSSLIFTPFFGQTLIQRDFLGSQHLPHPRMCWLLSFSFCVRCSLLFWVMFHHSFCGVGHWANPVGAPTHSVEQSTGWVCSWIELCLAFCSVWRFSTIWELFVASSRSDVLECIWVREKRGWEGLETPGFGVFVCMCGWDLPGLTAKKSSKGLSHHDQILLACYIWLL